MHTVVFAHGLEGSPDGTKVQTLREAGLTVVAPDGRDLPLEDRIRGIRQATRAHPNCVLVGSSYGGLAALAAVDPLTRLGEALPLHALVLLAPALMVRESPVHDADALVVPPSLPATILHGQRDSVVPIALSRALARRCPHVQLVERDDNHRLKKSLAVMVSIVKNLGQ